VQIGSRPISESDPLAKYLGKGAVVGGSTLFEVGLLDEINQRALANEPLESRHIDWLRADLVMTVAGFLAEEQLLGHIADTSAEGVYDAVKTAARLGFREAPTVVTPGSNARSRSPVRSSTNSLPRSRRLHKRSR
jgi:hypothetical protein